MVFYLAIDKPLPCLASISLNAMSNFAGCFTSCKSRSGLLVAGNCILTTENKSYACNDL